MHVSPPLFQRKLTARGQWFSNTAGSRIICVFENAEGWAPPLRVSDSVDLWCGPRIFISNKCPGDVDAAGPEAWPPKDHCSKDRPPESKVNRG